MMPMEINNTHAKLELLDLTSLSEHIMLLNKAQIGNKQPWKSRPPTINADKKEGILLKPLSNKRCPSFLQHIVISIVVWFQ